MSKYYKIKINLFKTKLYFMNHSKTSYFIIIIININYKNIIIMLENNESGLSDYTNVSIIQPVKQQLYDFTSRS